jgi:hypothetical protein
VKNSQLNRELTSASKSIEDGGPDGSDLFENLIEAHPDQRDYVLRERSKAYADAELFDEALADRLLVIDAGSVLPADCYFGGEYALQCGRFDVARDLFDRAATASIAQGATYYLQSSLLLAALASYQLHEDDRSYAYLDQVDDAVEVLWLKGFDRVSKALMLSVLKGSSAGD